MPILTGINIRKTNEFAYADSNNIYLIKGDKILIETENGTELANVVDKDKLIENPKNTVYKIKRKLDITDLKKIKENCCKERESYKFCHNKVEEKKINMKITCIEYTFDRSKLFIYYTSETRVDFRELIKDLAHNLKTKIQMVQIGVRDETKILGGYGHCGQKICCSTFLKDFKPVVIDMAKDQNMSLNSSKITGVCGRLICCLSYENNFYQEMKKSSPKIGEKVKIENKIGTVKSINYLKEEVEIIFEDETIKKHLIKDIVKN